MSRSKSTSYHTQSHQRCAIPTRMRLFTSLALVLSLSLSPLPIPIIEIKPNFKLATPGPRGTPNHNRIPREQKMAVEMKADAICHSILSGCRDHVRKKRTIRKNSMLGSMTAGASQSLDLASVAKSLWHRTGIQILEAREPADTIRCILRVGGIRGMPKLRPP